MREVLLSANAAALKQLITDTVDINQKDREGRTPFAYACMRGNAEIFTMLTSNGAAVHSFDNKGKSPFYFACKKGNLEALDYLLANSKILPRRADDLRRAPIHLATRFGHLPLVKKLWDSSEMEVIRDIHGNTPLHIAVRYGHMDIVKFMSANPKLALEKNREGDTPLTLAAAAMNKPLVEFFFSFGLRFRPSESYHALRGAVEARDAPFVRELLDKGLMISVRSGSNSIIDYAIETGAFEFLRTVVDDKQFDPRDLTPLALAHVIGNQPVIDFFVSLWRIRDLDDVLNQFMPDLAELPRSPQFVPITAKDAVKKIGENVLPWLALETRGITVPESDVQGALWGAFDRQDLKLMGTLLELGANPNCCNAAGCPLLCHAAKFNDLLPFVNLLLSYGASPDEPDAQTGCSPVCEALTSGNVNVLLALLPYGANINDIDRQGRSALTLAIERRKIETLEWLLELGANPQAVDDYGRIPLYWAVEARNERACKVLLENGSPTNVTDKRGISLAKLAHQINDRDILALVIR
jgi:ankyrin repeat protein